MGLSVDFSDIIEVYVTMLGIYSQQYNYMKIHECQRSFIDLCPR